MATVNYYLNSRANAKGQKLILLYFRYTRKQIVISTNELILPDDWDIEDQRAKARHTGYSYLNSSLLKYEAALLNIFQQRKYHNLSLLPSDLKPEFEKVLQPFPVESNNELEPEQSLSGFINSQISQLESTKNPNTLKTYRRARDILQEFEKTVLKQPLLFSNINLEFYQKWKEFVITRYKFSNNSINKHTGIIKLFMSEAADRNLHQNFTYRSRKFNTAREGVDSIYLNEEEISDILSLDLSSNERLERVRDLFIIGCRTGLRFSDLSNLREENISESKRYFNISKTKKTDASLKIPIHNDVLEIIEKYKEKTGKYIPSPISNQKMNKYLKEIGAIANLNSEISVVSKIGNQRTQEKVNKYELITCHTARRSFATNEYLAGTPPYIIMAITGHKTEKAFLTYIKIKQKQYAHLLEEHWESRGKMRRI